MGIEIVHHEANFLYVRIMLVNKFLDKVRPIHFCPCLRNFGIPLPSQGLKSHKNVCCPIASLVSYLSGFPGSAGRGARTSPINWVDISSRHTWGH